MISVVLPTYNERDGIVDLVSEILGVLRGAQLAAEVVVVDDNSPDGTADALTAAFRDDPAVRVIVRRDERGLASAIYRGFREARGETLVVLDSDGNHDPALIPALVRESESCDVAVGSRFLPGGGMLTSRFRYWASYGFNLFIRIVLLQPVHDNLSGYLVFRRGLLDRLRPDAIFYGYGDYAIRLLWQVLRGGGTVRELPTVYRLRLGGESKTRFLPVFRLYVAAVFRLRFAGR